MTYKFQTPEVLLNQINRRLLTLRGAVDSYLENRNLAESLTQVTRKLLIAQMLNDNFLISIAGSQGAGKTTFLQSLYKFDDSWIRGNEGRGEKSPVLILERDGITEPEGWIEELSFDSNGRLSITAERRITKDEFQEALKGNLANQIIPKLYVPTQFFGGSDRGFILLPGYETKDSNNAAWQELMRQSLIGSAMCIVVTDETRLANDGQKKILRDMYSHYLEGANPIVVVSKTENKSLQDREELRLSAAEVFQIAECDAVARVVCTGTGAVFEDEWRPVFVEKLHCFSEVASTVRNRQLDHLGEILRSELTDVLDEIRDALRQKDITSDEAKDYELIMTAFDKSKGKLRKAYEKQLKEALNNFADDAAKAAVKDYIGTEEGFVNGFRKVKRFCLTSTGEREEIHSSRIINAWKGGAGKGFYSHHVDVLGHITSPKLGLPAVPSSMVTTGSRGQHLLGYGDEKQTLVPTLLDGEVQKNIYALFFPDREGSLALNKEAERAVGMLPVLGLEFARIANIFPETVGIDAGTLQPTDLKVAMGNIEKDFGFLSKTQSDVIKAIAMMLAVDGAADGKIDTIPVLFNALFGAAAAPASAAAAGGTAAAAGGATATGGGAAVVASGAAATACTVAAVAGVALLTVAVTRELQRQDAEQRDLCRRIVYSIRDKHYEHYLSSFDDLMDTLREALDARLRVRYHMDEKLMWHDHVAKPLADVRSLKADMLEAIGGSPFAFMA